MAEVIEEIWFKDAHLKEALAFILKFNDNDHPDYLIQ